MTDQPEHASEDNRTQSVDSLNDAAQQARERYDAEHQREHDKPDAESSSGVETAYSGIDSRRIDRAQAQQAAADSDDRPTVTAERAFFDDGTVLRLRVDGHERPIVLNITGEMIVGRGDASSGYQPEVDLTPYGGYRLGLSRRHAKFTRHENRLYLVDMGSRNGTAINERPVPPESPQTLKDGDEVRFGNLVVLLSFQRRTSD